MCVINYKIQFAMTQLYKDKFSFLTVYRIRLQPKDMNVISPFSLYLMLIDSQLRNT